MTDIPTEIVNAIASSAGNSLGVKSVEAVARLVEALRAKLRRDPASRGTLEIAMDDTAEPVALQNLVLLLHERAARDAEFESWLAKLWAEVRDDLHMGTGETVNIIDGTVQGNAVQSGVIYGGIHFGDTA